MSDDPEIAGSSSPAPQELGGWEPRPEPGDAFHMNWTLSASFGNEGGIRTPFQIVAEGMSQEQKDALKHASIDDQNSTRDGSQITPDFGVQHADLPYLEDFTPLESSYYDYQRIAKERKDENILDIGPWWREVLTSSYDQYARDCDGRGYKPVSFEDFASVVTEKYAPKDNSSSNPNNKS